MNPLASIDPYYLDASMKTEQDVTSCLVDLLRAGLIADLHDRGKGLSPAFGELLVARRRERGMSRMALARCTYLNPLYLLVLERGLIALATIPPDVMTRLAVGLRCPLDEWPILPWLTPPSLLTRWEVAETTFRLRLGADAVGPLIKLGEPQDRGGGQRTDATMSLPSATFTLPGCGLCRMEAGLERTGGGWCMVLRFTEESMRPLAHRLLTWSLAPSDQHEALTDSDGLAWIRLGHILESTGIAFILSPTVAVQYPWTTAGVEGRALSPLVTGEDVRIQAGALARVVDQVRAAILATRAPYDYADLTRRLSSRFQALTAVSLTPREIVGSAQAAEAICAAMSELGLSVDMIVDTITACLLTGPLSAPDEGPDQPIVLRRRKALLRTQAERIQVLCGTLPYALAREVLTLGIRIREVVAEDAGAENRELTEDIVCRDPRAVLVLLYNHVLLLRTCLTPEADRARRYAVQASLQAYGPVAAQLGLRDLKHKIYALALRLHDPLVYDSFEQAIEQRRRVVEPIVERTAAQLQAYLQRKTITAQVRIDTRNLFGIYLEDQHHLALPFRLRIITGDVAGAYQVLRELRRQWRSGRVTDYINEPKGNGYQSIHTTIDNDEVQLPVQIRTQSMQRLAEQGVFAHLLAARKGSGADPYSDVSTYVQDMQRLRREPYLREDADRYIEMAARSDATADGASWSPLLYVRTRDGLWRGLPAPATVLDFAYHIHSRIGHCAIAATVDGRAAPLDYVLRNGEQVTILYRNKRNVRAEWLTFARTARACAYIREYMEGSSLDPLRAAPWTRRALVTVVADDHADVHHDIFMAVDEVCRNLTRTVAAADQSTAGAGSSPFFIDMARVDADLEHARIRITFVVSIAAQGYLERLAEQMKVAIRKRGHDSTVGVAQYRAPHEGDAAHGAATALSPDAAPTRG